MKDMERPAFARSLHTAPIMRNGAIEASQPSSVAGHAELLDQGAKSCALEHIAKPGDVKQHLSRSLQRGCGKQEPIKAPRSHLAGRSAILEPQILDTNRCAPKRVRS